MGSSKRERNIDIAAAGSAWRWPVAVLILATLLLFGGDTAREWLRFEREAIGTGEVWRLVTGHLVHLGGAHFMLNAVGLGLVWYLVGASFRAAEWTIVAIVSVGAIDLGLWFVNTQLEWYVGLSGLLHGVLAAGLLAGLRQPRLEMLALGVLLLAKLGWEQFNGPLPGSESTSGGPVVVAAHLYGTVGGALAGLLLVLIRVRPVSRI